MHKDTAIGLTTLGLLALSRVVAASTNMPWEAPLDMIAGSITGKAGAAAATIGIAFAGVNWSRGAEHGKEIFITTTLATSLIFGAARIVNEFGGGAGAAGLVPTTLPLLTFLSDACGELLGYLVALTWGWAAIITPWRERWHG